MQLIRDAMFFAAAHVTPDDTLEMIAIVRQHWLKRAVELMRQEELGERERVKLLDTLPCC